MNFTIKYLTEIGWLQVDGNDDFIESIAFSKSEPTSTKEEPKWKPELIQQLDSYFNYEKIEFNLPLKPKGTEFQQRVWDQLIKIPYGQTISYWELAKRIGDIKATRAVAAANGKNPIVIVIPCHRVIGKDGSLTGYSSGIERKKFLLELEKGIQPNLLF